MKLVEHRFSDLLIGPEWTWHWSRRTSGSLDCDPLPDALRDDVNGLREHLLSLPDMPDLYTTWDGMALRVSRKKLFGDLVIFFCRRFNLDEFSMEKIGIQKALVRELLKDTPLLKSGIIAIFGPPGAGKSTTLLSIGLDRISTLGGSSWSIGCPIEHPEVQGKHGKGWHYAVSVDREEQIREKIIELYRAVPNLLIIEEVRDAAVAREIIRAAGSGWLVGFTFHSNGLSDGISQFVRQASDGDLKATAARVADLMRVAIHVQLHTLPVSMSVKESTLVNEETAQGVPPQALSAEPVFFTEQDDAARSIVRSGEFHRLKDLISRQRRMLMNGESLLTQTHASSEMMAPNSRSPNGSSHHVGHTSRPLAR